MTNPVCNMGDSAAHDVNDAPSHVAKPWVDPQNPHASSFVLCFYLSSTKREQMPMTKTDRQKRPMRNCDRHTADKSGPKFAKLLMFIQVLRENSPMHIPHRRHAFSILVSQFDWSYMPLRL